MASVHGGCFPEWQQGSSVTNKDAPLHIFLSPERDTAFFIAFLSACRVPNFS